MENPARVFRPLFVDGTPVARGLIAFGIDGFIIPASSTTVMKIPRLDAAVLPDGSLEPSEENAWNADSLEVEKEIYRRLYGVKGLANCLNVSKNGLELEYYRTGELEDYIKNNSPPPWSQRSAWILQLVDFVAACHERKVLWFDIALRNILLADDMTIRAIDFANSTAVALDTDVEAMTSDGYTAKVEVLHVTNVIYSISRWTKFQTDCLGEEEWPAMGTFPATQGLELGHIISKAWGHEYSTVLRLRDAIHGTQDGAREQQYRVCHEHRVIAFFHIVRVQELCAFEASITPACARESGSKHCAYVDVISKSVTLKVILSTTRSLRCYTFFPSTTSSSSSSSNPIT